MTQVPVQRDTADTQPIPVVVGTPRGRHAAPRPRRSVLQWSALAAREVGIVAGVALAGLLVMALIVRPAYVPDDAMEPTLRAGERVVYTTWGSPGAGDIVVLRVPAQWSGASDEAIARIVALPGQQVTCCDSQGRITVDGEPLDEPYVDGATDQVPFNLEVPGGRAFVLVDRREAARDSRAALISDGGTVALDDILGRVLVAAWPPRVPS